MAKETGSDKRGGGVKEGVKHDGEKVDYTLLPFSSLEKIVKVLEFGAQKYARDNWQKVPNAERRYSAAALRHLIAREQGETNDPESGLPHLAHAGCCILFALWFESGRGVVRD